MSPAQAWTEKYPAHVVHVTQEVVGILTACVRVVTLALRTTNILQVLGLTFFGAFKR
jgi:hypothetical protein